MNGIGKVTCWVKWPEVADASFYSIRALRNTFAAQMKSRIQESARANPVAPAHHHSGPDQDAVLVF
jgi:hypothetical protein